MGFFDKVGSFLKREAKDLGEAAESVKDKLDEELTRREDELRMTPSEKIAALQQQAADTDAKLDAIADKATGRGAMADAVAEVGEVPPPDPALPNITHIVLPDGRVKSGADGGQVVDESGRVRDVPAVQAPTAEDLAQPDEPVADPAAAAASGLPETDPTPATITETDEETTAHAVEEVLDEDADPAPQAVPPADSGPEAMDAEPTGDLPSPPVAPADAAEPTGDLPPPPAAPADAAEPTGDLPPPPAAPADAAEPTGDLPPPPAAPVDPTPPIVTRTHDESTASNAVTDATEPAGDEPPPPAAPVDPTPPMVTQTHDQIHDAPATEPHDPTPPIVTETYEDSAAAAVQYPSGTDAAPADPVASAEPAPSSMGEVDTAGETPAPPEMEPTPATISETDEETTAHAVEEALDDDRDPAPQAVPPADEAADAAAPDDADPSLAAGESDAPDEPQDPTKDPSSPFYGKTPAQIKYEQARAAANDLLAELRGELEEEGEI